jgi:hypothetical protein
MAMAAGVGLTVAALGSATMVSPTLNCPLVCPARTKDQGSRHRTKANLHIFLLPARHQPSDFATGVCRDGTAVPSIRSAVAIRTKRSKDEARLAFATTVAVEGADESSSRAGMAGHLCPRRAAQWSVAALQHCLNFLPDPHGHGSLRPIFGAMRRTVGSLSDCISRDRCDAKWR